jgi:hypothetical protein
MKHFTAPLLTFVLTATLAACGYSSLSNEPATIDIQTSVESLEVASSTDLTYVGVADAVTWTSSDPSVATVSDTGSVTAVATGTTTITVAAKNAPDRTDTQTLTVTERTVVNLTDPADVRTGFNPAGDFTAADYDVAKFAVHDTGRAWVFELTRHGEAGGALAPRMTVYTDFVEQTDGLQPDDSFCLTPGVVATGLIYIDRLEDGSGALQDPVLTVFDLNPPSARTIDATATVNKGTLRVTVPKAELTAFGLEGDVQVETLYDTGSFAYDASTTLLNNIYSGGGISSSELRVDCIPGGEALISNTFG